MFKIYTNNDKYLAKQILKDLQNFKDIPIKYNEQGPITIHGFMENDNTNIIHFIKLINIKLLKLSIKKMLHKSINLKIWIFDNHEYSKHSDININKNKNYSNLFDEITICNIEDYFQFKEKFRNSIYNNYSKLLPCLLLISKTSKYDFFIIPHYRPITLKELKHDSLNCIKYFKNVINLQNKK
jgi:hypothetical protein